MAQETVFRREHFSGTLVVTMADRGKQHTDAPLVLSFGFSPPVRMVPGRVRKSLVTPRRLSRLMAIPLRRVLPLSHDLGRLPAMASPSRRRRHA
jgi:hypothetical protein